MNLTPPLPTTAECFSPSVAEERGVVLRNEPVNAEYRHLVADVGPIAASARPGQFFQLLCPAPPGEAPFFRRPMSVYGADPAQGSVSFLYKIAGVGTRGLATLRPGDELPMMGPLGHGFWLEPSWRHIVVVGRGVGLATLAPLAAMAQTQGVRVTALLSARAPSLIMSEEVFTAAGAQVVALTDGDGSADVANVEQILRGLIAAKRCDALFTCGSARLLRLLQRLSSAFDIPGQVALEQQMACGLGMCFCCVRDFQVDGHTEHRRVCWDGPVFDLREAVA